MFELHHLSAVEQLDWLRRGEITPRELAEHYLARIARLDGELGAFAVVDADAALARADAAAALPHALALWGLPTADKALVARAGRVSAFGSRAFAGHVPAESDELALVLDAAGAVSLGATAAPEFGFPSYTEPLAGRPARNPYDLALGAGGSSGGAAVAVAAGLLPVAPGSDGGGSIRIPAAATGLVGLKPSRGRVPAASGFETLAGLVTAGPLARTVADAGLLLDALVAPPGAAASWATAPPGSDEGPFLAAATRGEGRFQLAVSTDSPWAGAYELALDPAARAALELAIAELTALGHGIEELRIPEEPGYSDAFRTVWQAGAATLPLDDALLELVEPLTRWLVERGRALDARRLGEALAWLAGYERRTIARLAPYDAVLMPALALTPRPVGWYDPDDGEENFAQQVRYTPFTSFVNVAGLPAITLPVHATAEGLPMGVQLVGRPGGERTLLALGAQLERRLRWQRRHPPAWTA
ncbi:amidase [Protaetiibacter intestinalis]|uniref:Amidase n=1 Tax=Protaetiibacter intestinalis TaxID=2419774 RepID=A0A387B8T8_9MICO|nr:amidase [Protaetiibacter intestinalis]AYF98763.1 amidase [Protaetiibacter intestinalis]